MFGGIYDCVGRYVSHHVCSVYRDAGVVRLWMVAAMNERERREYGLFTGVYNRWRACHMRSSDFIAASAAIGPRYAKMATKLVNDAVMAHYGNVFASQSEDRP